MTTATITIRFDDDLDPDDIINAARGALLATPGIFEAVPHHPGFAPVTIDSIGAAWNVTEHGIPADITARALRNIVPKLGGDAQDLGEWAYETGIDHQDTAVLFRYLSGEAAADTQP